MPEDPGPHRRIIVVVNAAAGQGIPKNRFMEIRQALHGEPFGPAYLTLRRGHGEEWARTFRHERGFLVLGGEGTLHEVVSGMEIRTQAVAVVPMGRSTSLGRDLGMPNIADACGGIETGKMGKLDLAAVILRRDDGTVRRCRMVSSLAVGWPAEVARRAPVWHADFGPLAYAAAAVASGAHPPRFEVSLRYDAGRWMRKPLAGLLVGNTRHVMTARLFPDASPFDGRMEVLELPAGFARLALHGLSVWAGARLRLPTASFRVRPERARRLSVLLAAPRSVAVDGEVYDEVVRIEMRILPGGLKLFLPTGRDA